MSAHLVIGLTGALLAFALAALQGLSRHRLRPIPVDTPARRRR